MAALSVGSVAPAAAPGASGPPGRSVAGSEPASGAAPPASEAGDRPEDPAGAAGAAVGATVFGAVLTVGADSTGIDLLSGFSSGRLYPALGSMSDDSFLLNGVSHTVEVLAVMGDKLYLGIAPAPSSPLRLYASQLRLYVGATQFNLVDAYRADIGSIGLYGWNVARLGWGRGDTVEVTISIGDGTGGGAVPMPTVALSDARASEADGAVVFTATVTPPEGPDAPTAASEVSLSYMTAAGTATASRDYTHAAGVLRIPAGTRRATISVPLVDDSAAEGSETLTLRLGSAAGAMLASTAATATIIDDDTTATETAAPSPVCGSATVKGAVGDVFDIRQSRYAGWHHVFVDMAVTCTDTLATAAGVPTAVQVRKGPSGGEFLDAILSGQCLVASGTSPVTASLATAGGCRTIASSVPSKFVRSGEATHLLRLPDGDIGKDRQLFVWADLDADGKWDVGEPFDAFPSDFASGKPDSSGFFEYEYPSDFDLKVLDGSSRIGNAGFVAEFRLELRDLFHGAASRPLTGAPIGASVFAGPSKGAVISCYNRPSAASRLVLSRGCETDDNGHVVLRYAVSTELDNLLRQEEDSIRVFIDRDRDGRYDYTPNHPGSEPSQKIHLPIAKALNYVALGDSYSAGENGRRDTAYNTFDGNYLNSSVADTLCRRWDKAYPVVYANSRRTVFDILDIGLTFDTFACTGAVTANIHDPRDPLGTSTDNDHVFTNRPSKWAPELDVAEDAQGNPRLDPSPNWEPRQAVSLAERQKELERQMTNADMVTITIGGNDADFSDVLRSCIVPDPFESDFTCNENDLEVSWSIVENRIVDALNKVTMAARRASIFVLGYPYLAPILSKCTNTPRHLINTDFTELTLDTLAALQEVPSGCMTSIVDFQDIVNNCASLHAHDIVRSSSGFKGFLGRVASYAFTDRVRVDPGEAVFLQLAADDLNTAIENAASRAGVHYVDVLGGVASPDGPLSFEGHSPCDDEPWLNGYVLEPKNTPEAVSGRSFHPTVDGHRSGYAEILGQYIANAVADDAVLNEAGLPVNPGRSTRGSAGVGAASGTADPQRRHAGDGGRLRGDGEAQRSAEGTAQNEQAASAGFLFAERTAAAANACRSGFVSPGERVKLIAGGFKPGAAVSFSARGASLGSAELGSLTVPGTTADSDGFIAVSWTVPDAPKSGVDPAPRGYVVDASGAGAAGGTHTAYMVEPVVAYPSIALCAATDSVSTPLGRAVKIPVLANDTAPDGGSLDAASVRVRAAVGGTFTVDASTGSVTFTPESGFAGTVRTNYVVHDNWGVGARGDITVTVVAGCTITGTAGVTTIVGTDGDDVICVPDPDDRRAFHIIDAKGGDDVILGGAGVDWIYGGTGEDTIYGRGGSDRIDAGAGVDTVYGGTGADIVYSTDLTDTVHDPDGSELVVVPAAAPQQSAPAARSDWAHVRIAQSAAVDVLGNDHDPDDNLDPSTLRITRQPLSGAARVVAGSGAAVEYTAAGTGGADSFAYEICDSLRACATAQVTVVVGTSSCTIIGTAASETLYGTPGDDVICGLGGNDTIYGLGGNDTIIGGEGDDTLWGEAGEDTLWGGEGDDTLYGGADNDVLWGGEGDDTLEGNTGHDSLYGGAGTDTALGGFGADSLYGGDSDDTLYGGPGDDTAIGGPGHDLVRGGEGDDTLYGGTGDDRLIGWTGDDTLYGGPGKDALRGDVGNDVLWGGLSDDNLRGDGHQDQLHGGPGDDTLRGGDEADRIYGGTGDDTLYGGDGDDYLNGGPDTDTCTSGETTAGCEHHSDTR